MKPWISSLESVEIETVPVTPGNITVVPPVEQVGRVTPRLSFSVRIPTLVMITNTRPVVLGGVVTMGMGEIGVPVLAVSSVQCLLGISPVMNTNASITILVPDTLGNVTLLPFSFTDVAERFVSEVHAVGVLTVVVGGCPSCHGGPLPVDTRLAALGDIPNSSMELPPLFQVTEDVIEDRFQGLHGEDEFFNILSSICLRDSRPVGSEVALFVKFKLSSDDLQRSSSEVQVQVIIIVFVTGSLHVLLTTYLDDRSDAIIKVSSSLFPGIGGIRAFHALI